jgi:hypothetical protein
MIERGGVWPRAGPLIEEERLLVCQSLELAVGALFLFRLEGGVGAAQGALRMFAREGIRDPPTDRANLVAGG